MKQTIIFIGCVVLSIFGRAQHIDSILAEPQTIELRISTPQPRLEETFKIYLDINHLRANIFKSILGKVQLSNDISTSDDGELIMNVTATKKGKQEIGPLVFFLNETKYTTNKISFEVVGPLPATDNGIWFRKVMTSDSTFCIIIEQRIPASGKTTRNSENSLSFTTEPLHNDIVKFKDSYSIEGVSGRNSYSHTNFSSVRIKGEDRQFMFGYAIYYFNIKDKKAAIKITKDKFENIPADYKFEDIIIQ